MPPTVCLLSNVRRRFFPSIQEHRAKRMLGVHLRVTLNSDDPAYFGGYGADNHSAAGDGLDFDREDFQKVEENSFMASLLDEGGKRRHPYELASYFDP